MIDSLVPRKQRTSKIVIVLATMLLAGACSSRNTDPQGAGGAEKTGDSKELVAQVASYDLYVGEEMRFMVGLLTPEQQLVTGGKVQMDFSYLGTKNDTQDPDPGPQAVGQFLEVPTKASADAVGGRRAPSGIGVYAAKVVFDRPGFWQVQVTATSAAGPATAEASFEVLDDNLVPAPGDAAPAVENPTMDSVGVPAAAVDSRAETLAGVPDPELHQTTVRSAVEAGRPVLLVISTPTYCVSRFCGPITDMVAGLSADYKDKADFVHVEVWKDFDNTVVNKAAADWIFRNEDLQEPWVFLVGADGKVVQRWGNVATRAEIEPSLQAL